MACGARRSAIVSLLQGALVMTLVTATHGTAGSAAVPEAAGKVRGLGLRGGRELKVGEVRRKPVDENARASDIVLRDWKKRSVQPATALETLLADMLFKISEQDSFKIVKYLHIMSAREVSVPGKGERAIVIFVPFVEMQEYRKMCPGLTEALEDELKAHVFLIAHRRVIRPERKGRPLLKQKRPMSRTLKHVHEKYLEDMIWPQDVVGQKQVYEVDKDQPTEHIYLDPAERATTEHRMDAFCAVYQNLTGKKVVFEYLIYAESPPLVQQRTPNRPPTASKQPTKRLPSASEPPTKRLPTSQPPPNHLPTASQSACATLFFQTVQKTSERSGAPAALARLAALAAPGQA